MGSLNQTECKQRLGKIYQLLEAKNLDIALVYYDEFNIGNGWYLTGWCPQFESEAVSTSSGILSFKALVLKLVTKLPKPVLFC